MNDLTTYSVEINEQNCHTHTVTETSTNPTLSQIPEDYTGQTHKNKGSQEDSSHLFHRHIHDCCIKRGLDRRWIEAGCSSLNIKEASEYLHYQAKSPGILIKGANGQYQVKPDKPWADKQGKKAPKYRTARGDEYDALLPIHPTDPNYWNNIPQLKDWTLDKGKTICVNITQIKAENNISPISPQKIAEKWVDIKIFWKKLRGF